MLTRLVRRAGLGAVGAALLLLAAPGRPAAQEAPTVAISRLVEVSTNAGPAYSVAYTYAFPGRATVYIRGLGIVPGEGGFRYLTFERRLEFRDAADGAPILAVALEDPIRLMGSAAVEFPAESEFPEVSRSGRWLHAPTFPAQAAAVLNRLFPSGYRVYEDGARNHYVTTYSALRGLPARLNGRVAVRISHAVDAKPRGFEFRVHFLVRERRTHSEWRAVESDPVLSAAQRFVDDLIRDLEAGETSH